MLPFMEALFLHGDAHFWEESIQIRALLFGSVLSYLAYKIQHSDSSEEWK